MDLWTFSSKLVGYNESSGLATQLQRGPQTPGVGSGWAGWAGWAESGRLGLPSAEKDKTQAKREAKKRKRLFWEEGKEERKRRISSKIKLVKLSERWMAESTGRQLLNKHIDFFPWYIRSMKSLSISHLIILLYSDRGLRWGPEVSHWPQDETYPIWQSLLSDSPQDAISFLN